MLPFRSILLVAVGASVFTMPNKSLSAFVLEWRGELREILKCFVPVQATPGVFATVRFRVHWVSSFVVSSCRYLSKHTPIRQTHRALSRLCRLPSPQPSVGCLCPKARSSPRPLLVVLAPPAPCPGLKDAEPGGPRKLTNSHIRNQQL